ncbi:MAG: metallophosphoesterase [Halorhodospira sp.]
MPYTPEHLRVVHHPANTAGRDFVIGDLHGCMGALRALLDHAGFDPACDRLFSVGDLVDRGPASEEALGLLNEPWFFSVLGNHDLFPLVVLDAFDGPPHWPWGLAAAGGPEALYRLWIENGGEWALPHLGESSPSQQLQGYAQRLAQVPHVRVVGSGATRFQLVHAELLDVHTREPLRDAEVDQLDGTLIRAWCESYGIFALPMLWSRSLSRNGRVPSGTAESPVFCGHTPTDQIRCQAGHIDIDTGACFGGELTLVEPLAGRRYSVVTSPEEGGCSNWRAPRQAAFETAPLALG